MAEPLWDDEHPAPLRRRHSEGQRRAMFAEYNRKMTAHSVDPMWDDYSDLLLRCAEGLSLDAIESVPAASEDSLKTFETRHKEAFLSYEEMFRRDSSAFSPPIRHTKAERAQWEWEEQQRDKQRRREELAEMEWQAEEQRRKWAAERQQREEMEAARKAAERQRREAAQAAKLAAREARMTAAAARRAGLQAAAAARLAARQARRELKAERRRQKAARQRQVQPRLLGTKVKEASKEAIRETIKAQLRREAAVTAAMFRREAELNPAMADTMLAQAAIWERQAK